jgi:hypothetical protein
MQSAETKLDGETLIVRIPMRFRRRAGPKPIVAAQRQRDRAHLEAQPNGTLIKALVRAHRWRRRIESGQAKSITDLAEQQGVTDAYVCRLLPADLRRTRDRGSDPGRATAEGAEAGRDASEWAARLGRAASELVLRLQMTALAAGILSVGVVGYRPAAVCRMAIPSLPCGTGKRDKGRSPGSQSARRNSQSGH